MSLDKQIELNIQPGELICLEGVKGRTNFPYILIISQGDILYDNREAVKNKEMNSFFNFTLNSTGDTVYSLKCEEEILDIQNLIHLPSINKVLTTSLGPAKPDKFKSPPNGKSIYSASDIYIGKKEVIETILKKGHNLEPYANAIKSIRPSRLKNIDQIFRKVNSMKFP